MLVLFTPLDLARNHLSDFVVVIMTAEQRGKHFWIKYILYFLISFILCVL